MKSVHGHLLMKWYYKSAFAGMAENQTQTQKKKNPSDFLVFCITWIFTASEKMDISYFHMITNRIKILTVFLLNA